MFLIIWFKTLCQILDSGLRFKQVVLAYWNHLWFSFSP